MKPLELDQFLQYKFLSDVRFSPDGKRAVFVVRSADEKENNYPAYLYLYENGKEKRLSGLGQEGSFFWEDDTHVLFPACRTPAEKKRQEAGESFTSYYRLAVDGGEAQPAFELPLSAGELFPMDDGRYYFCAQINRDEPDAYLLSKEDKEKKIAEKKKDADYEVLEEHPFWFNGGTFRSGERTALFVYDSKDGSVRRMTEGDTDVSSVAWAGGKLWFLCETYRGVSNFLQPGLSCCDPATGEVTCIYPQNTRFFKALEAWNGGLLVLVSDGETHSYEQAPAACFYDVHTGTLTRICESVGNYYNSTGSDCRLGGGYGFKATEKGIFFCSTQWGNCHVRKLDETGAITPVWEGTGTVDCFDVAPDGSILAVAMVENRLQELYALEDGALRKLTGLNDEVLRDRYVSGYERITLQSEGEEIEGWILKPMDYDPNKTYPAILDIHGGPRTVYGEIFFHEMQFWAGQGYFVFFCNPIGSDGRGDDFADITGRYGVHDFRNLMDFTDAVLEKYPQIDRSRVAVTGGSYGGFMTNWIVGHTHRFCCAATQRSIANWISFYGTSDIGIHFGEYQTAANIVDSPEKMWQQSPMKYAVNFRTPTLIIHSDCDYRCPISEGYQMFTALQEQGVPTRMVVFHGENHELSRSGKPTHRVRRLTEITNWFKKYTDK